MANKIRVLIEVDGVQTPVLFSKLEGANVTQTEDVQQTIHLNNVDDAVRDALAAVGIDGRFFLHKEWAENPIEE